MNKSKVDLGIAMVDVAKRPPSAGQAGTAPGGKKPPTTTGKGSLSGPSGSSPKPKVAAKKGEEAAQKMALALSGFDMVSLQEVTDALPEMGMDEIAAFRDQLSSGEFLSVLKADSELEPMQIAAE